MSDFDIPTLSAQIEQTRNDINGRMPGADSRLRRSTLGILGKIVNGAVNALYGYMAGLAREFLVDTAIEWLPRHAGIWDVPQKAPAYASGSATLTGEVASVVDADTVLERGDGVQYATVGDVTFVGTTATAAIIALKAGAAGNALAGTKLSFVSPVGGVDSDCVVAVDIGNGADAEQPESWRSRILDRIRNPPQGGSRADYERWVKAVSGVTRVWVYPRWAGPGTVGVAFVYDGRESILPSAPERAAMADYLADLCPVHLADFGIFVLNLTAVPDNFEIHLTPDSPELRTRVTAAIADLYSRIAEPGGTIVLSQVAEAISLTAGETDHVIVLPAGNITHTATQMPLPGTIDWGD